MSRLHGRLETSISLALELEQRIDPRIEQYWNNKIAEGIVPTEVKLTGAYDKARHQIKATKLAFFEAFMFRRLLHGPWKPDDEISEKEIHYFGVGTGEALEIVTPLVNAYGYGVISYDTSYTGYVNSERVFSKQKSGITNISFIADICVACNCKDLKPNPGSKLVAARVLDVLDTQEEGYEDKAPCDRKMPRTARGIGRLILEHDVDVLIIHPCPEDNPRAIWKDTTPHPLEEVVGYIQEGLGEEPEVERLDTHDYYGHIYTGISIRRKSS